MGSLLLAVMLLGLLAGDAAASGLLAGDAAASGLLAGDAAASSGVGSLGFCDAAHLAGEIAATCAAGGPTLACCEPLVASVVLGGGGDCLCSVAHEMPVMHAGLNATVLVALHTACSGAVVVSACYGSKAVGTVASPSGGVHHTARSYPAPLSAALELLPAAAATPTPGPSSSEETPIGAGCDSATLGYQIERECGSEGRVNGDCCEGVVAAVDTKGCLCAVMNDTSMADSSPLRAKDILDLYKKCDGLRPLNGQSDCLEVVNKDASPTPVQGSASGSGENDRLAHKDYILDVAGVVLEALSITGVVLWWLRRWFTSCQEEKAAAKLEKMEVAMSRLHVNFRKDIQADLRASVLDVLRSERPAQVPEARANDAQELSDDDDIKTDEELLRKNSKAAKGKAGISNSE